MEGEGVSHAVVVNGEDDLAPDVDMMVTVLQVYFPPLLALLRLRSFDGARKTNRRERLAAFSR